MIGNTVDTLLAVVEYGNFSKAAEALSLTQPAISHHIKQLEDELGASLFIRAKGTLRLTKEGEIAVKYAKRLKSLDERLIQEIKSTGLEGSSLTVGVTHTAESNFTMEVLAKFSNMHEGLTIKIITDTQNNLYRMLENYDIDLAIIEGEIIDPNIRQLTVDTDYLVCVLSPQNILAKKVLVSLNELKRQPMILRLPSSDTRALFENNLRSVGDNIENYNVSIELDNIATIKDLVKSNFGVSILPRSSCIKEFASGQLIGLPVENLNMIRETRIAYYKDFTRFSILGEIIDTYRDTISSLNHK